MRIFLGDLCHYDESSQNVIFPLGVGFIASYLKKVYPNAEVRIFKDPRKLIDALERKPPQILALSQYAWNVRLDAAIIRKAKKLNPDIITVLGGPWFDKKSQDWIKNFFQDRPELDIYITGESEWSFSKLVELLVEYAYKLSNIPFESFPASFYMYDHILNYIINNKYGKAEKIPLADIPSPYLTGLFDDFIKEGQLQPILETTRGCPYSCTFCCWGDSSKSKINYLPLERVKEEIDFLSTVFRGKKSIYILLMKILVF